MPFSSLSDFFFELSVLKKLPRSGSFIAGVLRPDTVGEHVFRATQIAYILAEIEGANPEHSMFLTMIHDNAESRVGDHHKIMSRYIDAKEGEKKAFTDQIQNLPPKIAIKFAKAFAEFIDQKTIESHCAKDADLLELAFQSREYLEQGYSGKQDWLTNISTAIKTQSGKELFNALQNKSSNDWWQGLKKV